jgi:hypothetical protein
MGWRAEAAESRAARLGWRAEGLKLRWDGKNEYKMTLILILHQRVLGLSRFSEFPINSTPAMSIGLDYVIVVDYAEACRRLRDDDASLIAFQFVKLKISMLISRFNRVDIKDAAAFVEGMRHNTHLQGLWYVP